MLHCPAVYIIINMLSNSLLSAITTVLWRVFTSLNVPTCYEIVLNDHKKDFELKQ